MSFLSQNPYNLAIVGTYQAHTATKIAAKLVLATKTQSVWSDLSVEERGKYFRDLAAYLRKNSLDFATLITCEMGKIISESLAEVEKCAGACEYFAEQAAIFLQKQNIATEAKESGVSYEAAGLVFTIMPWNFPFWQVFRYAAAALMAGNVTILKHAPNVFGCALAIEKAFEAVGFPKGVFQSLICEVSEIPNIIADDRVAMVSFTGSEKTGGIVASLAGKHIKKCVLELGGSDALIVLKDADIAKAAEIAVKSRMANAGQVCIAAKRFLVEKSIKNDFLEKIVSHTAQLTGGDPMNVGTKMGVLARLDLADTLEKQLQQALTQGANLVYGGKRQDCWFEPTVIENVGLENVAFQEETFGPLAAISTFEQENEALFMANYSRYGLSASVWTTDMEKAAYFVKQLKAGSVFVNDLVRSDYRLPIGGTKKSGFGRELSAIGIQEFCIPKTYWVGGSIQK